LFAPDALEFFVAVFLVHELASVLIPLGPMLFALDLRLELRALADGSVAVSVAGGGGSLPFSGLPLDTE
jgi:hypothetical protein